MKWYRLAAEDFDSWVAKLNAAYMELYGQPMTPDAEAHYRSKGEAGLAMLKANYEMLKSNWQKLLQQQQAAKQQKEVDQQRIQDVLETSTDTYYRVEGSAERVVCDAPDLHIKGMVAYEGDLVDVDPELKGYYAVHTGDADAWLPILVRDGYCSGTAYVYQILCAESQEPFYEMEDYHVMDKTEAPGGTIIFSKYKVIPPQLIRLVRVVENPESAPDLY